MILTDFIAAIRSDHAGNSDLLIFADWLEERGSALGPTLMRLMAKRLVIHDPRGVHEAQIGQLVPAEAITVTWPDGRECLGVYESMERDIRPSRHGGYNLLDPRGIHDFRQDNLGKLKLVLQLLPKMPPVLSENQVS